MSIEMLLVHLFGLEEMTKDTVLYQVFVVYDDESAEDFLYRNDDIPAHILSSKISQFCIDNLSSEYNDSENPVIRQYAQTDDFYRVTIWV